MSRINTKSLADELNKFVQANGLSHLSVFSDLLDYIIAGFDLEHKPIKGWKYDAKQTQFFAPMTMSYLNLMKEELQRAEWYDAWGDLFMELVGHFAGYRGQFFTPPSLTDGMAAIMNTDLLPSAVCGAFGSRIVACDPACGSSRTLLSIHSKMIHEGKDKPYLIGEDLDNLCVKMSAINMCVHGCFGEVVCHNSLEEQGSVRFGYIINQGLYPFPGLPSIRYSDNPALFICCR